MGCAGSKSAEGASTAPAAAPKTTTAASDPELIYFGIAGRGELTKLCAVAGGVKVNHTKIGFGEHGGIGPGMTPPLPPTLPIMKHGDLVIYESLGIETYICNLSPTFSKLTPQQILKDDMFANIKEDIQQVIPPYIFSEELRAKVKEELTPKMEKLYATCEGLCPAKGFVNGLAYPTKADLAILNMVRGYMPYGFGIKHTEFDVAAKCPNMFRISEAAAAAPGVKEYLASEDCTMTINIADP